MAHTTSSQSSAHPNPVVDLSGSQVELVHLQLGRILESPGFRNSKRCQKFLRFIVESTLAGNREVLKERTVAMEVFDRPAAFDSSGNATVRVAALEVRKRLSRYYLENGASDEVQIVLPLGSYIPEFRFRDLAQPDASPVPQLKRRRLLAAGIAAAVVAAVAAGLMYPRPDRDARLFLDFWRPVLENPSPVIICLYSAPVYVPSEQPGSYTPANGRFVELGDAIGAGHLAAVLSRFHKEDQTRVVGDLSFADLRRSPTILVGASLALGGAFTSQYRFLINEDEGERVIMEQAPPYRSWRVPVTTDGTPNEDYGIATRVFDSEPGRVLMSVTGIHHYGTKAAAELFGASRYLSDALAKLPAGWQKQNVQFVIHVKIIGKTTGPPAILAAHAW